MLYGISFHQKMHAISKIINYKSFFLQSTTMIEINTDTNNATRKQQN